MGLLAQSAEESIEKYQVLTNEDAPNADLLRVGNEENPLSRPTHLVPMLFSEEELAHHH